MAGNPPSIGDDVEKFKLIRETHELPKQRKDVVLKFGQILDSGGVQRVLIQLGKPILVDRLVKPSDDPGVPFELPEDDVFMAARNAPIGIPEFDEKRTPFETLFVAFEMVVSKGAQPVAIYVDRAQTMWKWLKIGSSTVFGVEVRENGEMPQDAGLLIGGDVSDPLRVVYSVRFDIQIPTPKKERKT